MNIQEAVKEQNKRDIKFWTSVSDLDTEILSVMYRFGYPQETLARQLDIILGIELKISQIEL